MSLRGLLAGCASALAGACLALAYPPWGLWPLCVLTFALLGRCFSRATSAREAFTHGWITGSVASLLSGLWLIALVPRFTVLPRAAGVLLWALVSVLSGSSLGLAGALTVLLGARAGRPFGALVGVLVCERFGVWLFPLPMAAPLVDAPYIPQSADLFGLHFLGAMLCACSVSLFDKNGSHPLARGLRALGPIAVLCAYGALREPEVLRAMARAKTLRVALVQPAVGAALRWDPEARESIHRHLETLTREAFAQAPDAVVWHEAAFPYVLPLRSGRDGEGAPRVLRQGASAPLLFGAMALGPDGGRYNSAFVLSVDGALSEPVSKRVRVLFGEYIPLVGLTPWLRRVFPRVQGLRAGDRPEILRVGVWALGVLNCLEDAVPSAGAEVADADLLVNLSNDAWFDGAEPAEHLLLARWRSIETRREMVRAVNTGMSGHIDALGRTVARSPPGVPWVMLVHPKVGLGITPWAPVLQGYVSYAGLFCALGGVLEGAHKRLRTKYRMS